MKLYILEEEEEYYGWLDYRYKFLTKWKAYKFQKCIKSQKNLDEFAHLLSYLEKYKQIIFQKESKVLNDKNNIMLKKMLCLKFHKIPNLKETFHKMVSMPHESVPIEMEQLVT